MRSRSAPDSGQSNLVKSLELPCSEWRGQILNSNLIANSCMDNECASYGESCGERDILLKQRLR